MHTLNTYFIVYLKYVYNTKGGEITNMTLNPKQQPVEIDFTIIEAVVNTYVEIEIDLPVDVNQQTVFDLDEIEYNMLPAFDPVAAGGVSQLWQLTFTSQSAILDWDNDQVIAGGVRHAHASAAALHSGDRLWELHVKTADRANFIARRSVFLGIDSTNTTVVFAMRGRLVGSILKIKQDQLTQLVLNQLT